MCGIIGVLAKQGVSSNYPLQLLVKELLLLSESRGKEASGIAFAGPAEIRVYNSPQPASVLIRQPEYREALSQFSSAKNDPFVCFGHARLVTNGSMEYSYNNQPVIKDGIVGIHNGIIVNDAALWQQYPDLQRKFQVDTEVALSSIRHMLRSGENLERSLQQLYRDIRGTASMAMLFDDRPEVVLATNNGSLYLCVNADQTCLFFASELHIAEKIIETMGNSLAMSRADIKHIGANEAYSINPAILSMHSIHLSKEASLSDAPDPTYSMHRAIQFKELQGHPMEGLETTATTPSVAHRKLQDIFGAQYARVTQAIAGLKRCTRCVLPETMPFISFDANGVCNYCQKYVRIQYRGTASLDAELRLHTQDPKHAQYVVCLSGGRDSSYGLYYMKKVLGLHVVAYSYDWGMVTDLARRNQARMCGALGVEHIIVSADIREKRSNIRKNVLAWLQKPDLGTIPLFMAGDKQYFYYANQVLKQTHSQSIIMSENELERTHFKHGFSHIKPAVLDRAPYVAKFSDKVALAAYYAKQFIVNPRYLNSSVLDSIGAFASYYFIPHDYIYLFHHIPWNEEVISKVLLREYDWEVAEDTHTTWRIGDGTAPFYNYIYYVVAGFTENDTFRSNQIREGILDRATALTLVERDNQPRYASIDWYCQTIAIDTEAALRRIHSITPLYKTTG